MKIDLLSLFTDRFEEMKRFYLDVLGFEIATELENYVEFSGQGVRFSICNRSVMVDTVSEEHFAEAPTGRPISFAFRSESKEAVETDYAALVAEGAEAVKEPSIMPWGQYTAFFADPDGHVHELFVDLPREA